MGDKNLKAYQIKQSTWNAVRPRVTSLTSLGPSLTAEQSHPFNISSNLNPTILTLQLQNLG
ncbi:unnamed protein product [Sphenostylis stenocarpa]|uniref:Uncharacterized protein n=1 Tax=Sphenostylis stenocarpa TaxID=92480 RepID=A0AA86VPL3_9FABA|nr:unnamed protein product [Sphenostylis stenocarpa]